MTKSRFMTIVTKEVLEAKKRYHEQECAKMCYLDLYIDNVMVDMPAILKSHIFTHGKKLGVMLPGDITVTIWVTDDSKIRVL